MSRIRIVVLRTMFPGARFLGLARDIFISKWKLFVGGENRLTDSSCYYARQSNAVNLRIGAQALIQSTVFEECTSAVVSENSDVDGYAVLEDVELGGGA